VNRGDKPVFKTFFSANLSREEVLDLLISSLSDKNKLIEDLAGNRLKIRGVAHSGVTIITILNKNSGEIVTFYPHTEQDKEKTTSEQRMHRKFFSGNTVRNPITDLELDELMQDYKDGVAFNMVFTCRMNIISGPPSMLLYKSEAREQVAKDYPKASQVYKVMDKVVISREFLADIFSEKNDGAFPPYLSRKEILSDLQDALDLITVPSEDHGITDSGTQLSFYPLSSISKKQTRDFPIARDKSDGLKLRSYSLHKDLDRCFRYMIALDKDTGALLQFYPLATLFEKIKQ
jgi:hypothetical protein